MNTTINPLLQQFSPQPSPSYYKYRNRVVRYAYLCGRTTNYDYEHRRDWLMARFSELAKIFAIEVIGCTVLPTYYQVVVRIDKAKAANWSCYEIAKRWGMIYRVPELLQREIAGETNLEERLAVAKLLAEYRLKLCTLGWFMRCIHEPLAKMANAEDDCQGAFWEGKVKPKLLKNQAAVDKALYELFAPFGVTEAEFFKE